MTLREMASSPAEYMEFAVLYEAGDKELLKAMRAYRGGGRDDSASKVARHIKSQREEREKATADRAEKKAAKEKAVKERAAKATSKAAAKPRPKKTHIDSAPAKRLAQLNAKKKTEAFPPCAGSGARPRPRCVPKQDKQDHEMTELDLFGSGPASDPNPDSDSDSDSDSEDDTVWSSRCERLGRPWLAPEAAGSAKQVKA